MSWWIKIKKVDKGIKVGDYVTNSAEFKNLNEYFSNGPLKVARIDDGPNYAGGKFVICEWACGEQGFYFNAVKKHNVIKFSKSC